MSGARTEQEDPTTLMSSSSARRRAANAAAEDDDDDESFETLFRSTDKLPVFHKSMLSRDSNVVHSILSMIDASFVEVREVQQLASEMARLLQKIGTLDRNARTAFDVNMVPRVVSNISLFMEFLFKIALKKDHDSDVGGKYTLLCQTLCLDPSTLEALLQILDSWTGGARCATFEILASLHFETPMGDVELGDGSLFRYKLISKVIRAMEVNAEAKKEGRNIHDGICKGHSSCTQKCLILLGDAVVTGKVPFRDIAGFDWTAILDFQPGSTIHAMEMFSHFHAMADRALEEDPTDDGAQTFLTKLGASKKLFHQVLNWVISGEAEASDSVQKFDEFFNKFVRCLIPPPSDKKTAKLVKQACSKYKRWASRRPHLPNDVKLTIALMEENRWKELQRFSGNDCWQFYKSYLLVGETSMKQIRHDMRGGMPVGERICAHCFTSEKDLSSGKKMENCSRCLGMCYCCRTCQVQHWSVHKKQCKKVSVAK